MDGIEGWNNWIDTVALVCIEMNLTGFKGREAVGQSGWRWDSQFEDKLCILPIVLELVSMKWTLDGKTGGLKFISGVTSTNLYIMHENYVGWPCLYHPLYHDSNFVIMNSKFPSGTLILLPWKSFLDLLNSFIYTIYYFKRSHFWRKSLVQLG